MKRRSVVLIWALIVTAVAAAGWFGYQAFAARRVSQETDRLAEILALGPTAVAA
jgi:hypothetical protein